MNSKDQDFDWMLFKYVFIVLIGAAITGFGGLHFFKAGVSMNTATGITGGSHVYRMLAALAVVFTYWFAVIYYLLRKRKK